MTLRSRYITYRSDFVGLVTGVSDHQPTWAGGDCPSCGTVPCYHPDLLVCAFDDEEWPCETIRVVAAELRTAGRDYGVRDPVRRTLVKRAAALLRGVRRRNAQYQDQSSLS